MTFWQTTIRIVLDGGILWREQEDQKQMIPQVNESQFVFKEDEYDLLLEYAENHKMTIAQVIRLAVEMQVLADKKK